MLKFESPSPGETDQNSPHGDLKSHMYGIMSRTNHGPLHHASYNHAPQHHAAYDPMAHERSPSSTPTESGMGQQHPSHNHNHCHGYNNNHDSNMDQHNQHSGYEADFAQSGLVSGSYSYMGLNPINDIITFNSQEVNFDMLGLHSEMMPPWLEILPGDVLGGLFEGGMMGTSHM